MNALPLAPGLDTAAAAGLHGELLSRLEAGQPVLLDGSAVVRVGQACLQLLAAARAEAAARGLAFAIVDPSQALVDMASLARLHVVLEPLG